MISISSNDFLVNGETDDNSKVQEKIVGYFQAYESLVDLETRALLDSQGKLHIFIKMDLENQSFTIFHLVEGNLSKVKTDLSSGTIFNAFNIDDYKYLNYVDFVALIQKLGLETVPILRDDYILTIRSGIISEDTTDKGKHKVYLLDYDCYLDNPKLIKNVSVLINKYHDVIEKQFLSDLEIKYLKRQIIEPIKTGQLVMINIGTARTIGICKNINTQNKKTIIIFSLKLPVCADEKQIAAISKQINGRWRLIAKGVVI